MSASLNRRIYAAFYPDAPIPGGLDAVDREVGALPAMETDQGGDVDNFVLPWSPTKPA